jgi:hypothetical protein
VGNTPALLVLQGWSPRSSRVTESDAVMFARLGCHMEQRSFGSRLRRSQASYPVLRCSWCPGSAPMPKVVGLHASPPPLNRGSTLPPASRGIQSRFSVNKISIVSDFAQTASRKIALTQF